MSKWFGFKDFDGHYILTVFGIKIGIKHKCRFDYKPAYESGVTKEKRSAQIIVSLTSFPGRISCAHLSINTLLQQTMKPDRLILWLAEEQFPQKENELPTNLTELTKLGLEIKWCEDLKSYKKLLPALKEFPNDIIITADDDIYYEPDWLESLYKAYKKHNCIICQRPRRLYLNNDKINVYTSRKSEGMDLSKPDYFNQMLGGTGCLYPPHSLHKDVLNYNIAKELLPTNDDIYFWAMAVLNNTKIGIAKGFNGNIFQMDSGENTLGHINSHLEQNEQKNPFEILCNEYPQLMKILKSEVYNG